MAYFPEHLWKVTSWLKTYIIITGYGEGSPYGLCPSCFWPMPFLPSAALQYAVCHSEASWFVFYLRFGELTPPPSDQPWPSLSVGLKYRDPPQWSRIRDENMCQRRHLTSWSVLVLGWSVGTPTWPWMPQGGAEPARPTPSRREDSSKSAYSCVILFPFTRSPQYQETEDFGSLFWCFQDSDSANVWGEISWVLEASRVLHSGPTWPQSLCWLPCHQGKRAVGNQLISPVLSHLEFCSPCCFHYSSVLWQFCFKISLSG